MWAGGILRRTHDRWAKRTEEWILRQCTRSEDDHLHIVRTHSRKIVSCTRSCRCFTDHGSHGQDVYSSQYGEMIHTSDTLWRPTMKGLRSATAMKFEKDMLN
ncbi:hypothetical protein KIN20_034633 [Parelaphostrongylus tenuis]|uniref:Uncharacterized protein n=1 Tax=Parelaphostrongylus tenuis TaxID=148309 RepID=A0AAD5RAF9_PARTN|nr:hypothetical protein KIN20_034633 [Parelaphostrongylus tenuis]